MERSVFEVAVYKVKKEKLEQFLQQQPIAHGIIRKFNGFKSLRTLRSMESPNLFVDYCEWESHDDALEAGKTAVNTPELELFFELGDGMISFGHYTSGILTEAQQR